MEYRHVPFKGERGKALRGRDVHDTLKRRKRQFRFRAAPFFFFCLQALDGASKHTTDYQVLTISLDSTTEKTTYFLKN